MPTPNNDKVSVEKTKVGLQTRIAEAAAGLEEEVAKNDTHEKVIAAACEDKPGVDHSKMLGHESPLHHGPDLFQIEQLKKALQREVEFSRQLLTENLSLARFASIRSQKTTSKAPQPQPTQTGLLSMFTQFVDQLRVNGYRVDDASFNACCDHNGKPTLSEANINIVVRGFQIAGGGNA